MELSGTARNLLWLYSGTHPGCINPTFLRYMVANPGYVWPVVERLWADGWLDVRASSTWIPDSWGIPYGSQMRERPIEWGASLTPKGRAWIAEQLRDMV